LVEIVASFLLLGAIVGDDNGYGVPNIQKLVGNGNQPDNYK
jgi:hypothetical protein